MRCRAPFGPSLRDVVSLRSARTHEGSHPPSAGIADTKRAALLQLFFEDGGEGGIRTLDTLPYTHFPGVLLQPLGHLTVVELLFRREFITCCTPWGANGALIYEKADLRSINFLLLRQLKRRLPKECATYAC